MSTYLARQVSRGEAVESVQWRPVRIGEVEGSEGE